MPTHSVQETSSRQADETQCCRGIHSEVFPGMQTKSLVPSCSSASVREFEPIRGRERRDRLPDRSPREPGSDGRNFGARKRKGSKRGSSTANVARSWQSKSLFRRQSNRAAPLLSRFWCRFGRLVCRRPPWTKSLGGNSREEPKERARRR